MLEYTKPHQRVYERKQAIRNLESLPMTDPKNALSHGTAVLEKALDVLEAVAVRPQGLSQAALSQKLGLPRTTVYRLLAKLVERGMIRHDLKRRSYALGYKCIELARKSALNPDLLLAAAPELRMLRDQTGETTYLAVLEEQEAVVLERYDGVHSHRSQAALGQRKPLHCTSQGKAILAAMAPPQRDPLLKSLELKAMTPASITDRRKLSQEIRQTATRGWSVDDEEIVPGIRCVGAAVVDYKGEVRGSISIAGPAFRMTRERIEALGSEVAEAARRIGAQLSGATHEASHPDVALIDSNWAFRGEFPCWSNTRQTLYWADSLAPSVHALHDQADREIALLDAPVTGLVLSPHGLLIACHKGFAVLDPTPAAAAATVRLKPWPAVAPVALCGNGEHLLWACSEASARRWRVHAMTFEGEPHGDAGWSFAEPIDALAWDKPRGILYGLIRDTGVILMMRAGQNSARRLATVPRGSGRLTGLAVDAEGSLWAALHEGWSVMRFSPDGRQEQTIGLPVPSPTGLCLGGPNQKTLFITTARQTVSLEALAHAPLSGHLFSLSTEGLEATQA